MPTTSAQIIKRTFSPTALVGQVYARLYGSNSAPLPIGNVLGMELTQKEDVEKQPDMTALGGGTHAEMRRVSDVAVKIKMADLNVTNLARAALGTTSGVEGGTVTNEAHTATLGGLIRTAHIGPRSVVVKKGVTPVVAAGNYEVRGAGVYILPEAADLADADAITVDYAYGSYAVIEAITKKASELELTLDGLNEAGDTDENGNPRVCVVELWRASQGVAAQIALLAEKGFATLDVEGAILKDASKTGVGISKYYRVSKN